MHLVKTESSAQCTHPWPSLREHCARTAPCRKPGLAVSQAWPDHIVVPSRPCRKHVLLCRCTHARAGASCRSAAAFAPGHNTILSRDSSPLPRAPRAVSRAHNAVSWRILRRIVTCIAAPITTQMPPQAMIQSLYRDTHPQRPSPRSHASLLCARAGRVKGPFRPCRRPSPRLYRGPIRPYRGRPCVPTAPCVTIQSTVS